MATTDAPDLRSALGMLRGAGELAEVTAEVDWNRELGTVARETLRRKGPALLFRNIKDYNGPDARCGQVVTSILASHRRIALLLGLDPSIDNRSLVDYVTRTNRERVTPKLVADGPVHENVLLGDDVDLTAFPVPHWHHLDGGRYINTFGAVVTKDPVSGIGNAGVYRGMIADRDKISMLLVPSQHWGRHWAEYLRRGEPMPVASVYGWHPVMDFLAGSPIPRDVCEYDVMGAYLGEPVELVRCRTVDLEVPASAELVVEGYISPDPDRYRLEGPFGEFTGYVSDLPTPRPTVEVTAITHRSSPIFRGTLEGSLPGASGENSYMSSVQRAAIAWHALTTAGVPGITDVYVHPVTNGTTIVVQIDKVNEGHAKWVAAALWSTGAALYRYKYVIVVDEDIDPSDYSAIDWAIAYRVRPGSDDIVVFPGTFGSPIDPSTPLEDRSIADLGSGLWNRMLVDATRTWRYPPQPQWGGARFPPTVAPAPEDLDLVRGRWAEYGFTGWDGGPR
ncbi:UbiD family decarboxylase [Phytohabitans sp. ZYX-F-186]|uniref:UbiD family decarboxylase n=1 Tax=Phytohabitans maris TaxID=3071409 RepID=A0ABU0ZT09_9ACTN|nr:UbiD family decarboxylase [Phytohabitans sp. ZYX-F-186]MDQ7910105.1 UbiD family decarboxylase [Phytohabitans sp. ZYX-F-186]